MEFAAPSQSHGTRAEVHSADPTEVPHVVVVGGGITGLTVAWRLMRDCAAGSLRVTVVEASPQFGGKLRESEVAGVKVDVGAESVLARRPEATALISELGLGEQLVAPALATAQLVINADLVTFPSGTVMGIAADPSVLAGVLSTQGLRRVHDEPPAPPLTADVSVGELVGQQLGREVVDRVVEPMLAGVYAGDVDKLSFAATMPGLAAEYPSSGGLTAAARSLKAKSAARVATEAVAQSPPAALVGLVGGVAGVVTALVDQLAAAGAQLQLNTTVRDLTPNAEGGWSMAVGPVPSSVVMSADAVVVATPALASARLLGSVAPAAAAAFAEIEAASVGVVSLAFAAKDMAEVAFTPSGTGYLIPSSERARVKAVTFSSAKWTWLRERAPGLVFIRASVGRYGDVAGLQRPDTEVVAMVRSELAERVGLTATPVDSLVTRWGGSLPQYNVGHLIRVAAIRADLTPHRGLVACGASLDGVGIAACVASATDAANQISSYVAALAAERGGA